MSRYIPRVLSSYCDNENVILCLLRKKDPLAKIYGKDSLYKRFKWPTKPTELNKWITQRYQARGLSEMLVTMQCLFDAETISTIP